MEEEVEGGYFQSLQLKGKIVKFYQTADGIILRYDERRHNFLITIICEGKRNVEKDPKKKYASRNAISH